MTYREWTTKQLINFLLDSPLGIEERKVVREIERRYDHAEEFKKDYT